MLSNIKSPISLLKKQVTTLNTIYLCVTIYRKEFGQEEKRHKNPNHHQEKGSQSLWENKEYSY